MKKVINIPLTNGNKLTVEVNDWNPDFPAEICISVSDDLGYLQDVCLVRQHYQNIKNGVPEITDDIDVLVWSESDNEDYTEKFVICQRKEEE